MKGVLESVLIWVGGAFVVLVGITLLPYMTAFALYLAVIAVVAFAAMIIGSHAEE
jgi:hypothetical protein